MFCDFKQIDANTIRCRVCGQAVTAPGITSNVVAKCDPNRVNYPPFESKGLSHLPREMEEMLQRHGPMTCETLMNRMNRCNRIPGILAGMVASGKIKMSTEKTLPETLYSIASSDAAKIDTPPAFARSYVINLKRRADRLKDFLDGMKNKGWQYDPPIVYPAIDGDRVGVPVSFTQGGGAFGCRQSHVRILEDCLMDGVDSVLVFEDDAELCDNFAEKYPEFLAMVPADWEGIMLGGQHHATPTRINDRVVRVANAQRTHAYIARGNYLRALHKRWADASVHIDWKMRGWQHLFNVYAPTDWIVAQGGGRSDITGRIKPLENWSRGASFTADNKPPASILLNASRSVMEELRKEGFHNGYWRCDSTDLDRGLIDVFALTDPVARVEKLREWHRFLANECRKDGLVLTVWHPLATHEFVSQSIPNLHQIDAQTAEEAMEKYMNLGTENALS